MAKPDEGRTAVGGLAVTGNFGANQSVLEM
jgi:hypothetical protein